MFTLTALTFGAIGLAAVSWALQPQSVGVARAPLPNEYADAVVQVYGADVWGVRGRFAIHTWIVTKLANAERYTKYQVIGWRLGSAGSALSISHDRPDAPWFGAEPVLLLDRRGADAARLVDRIHDAALRYPYADQYVMWPGPNSNSFTAWIGLEVPELGLELPIKAIGKSWMIDKHSTL